MNRYKLHICFALLFMAVGLARAASVSVLLPASLASPLSVNNRGAQAALQTANAVLTRDGFAGGQLISPNARDAGQLAVFNRDISFGNPTACNVSVLNNRVVFSFVESGIANSSSATAQLANQLANALAARFGPASVELTLR